MAGAAVAGDGYEREKRVLIAVDSHFDERLGLARRVALAPQAPARARPVMDDSGQERRAQSGLVHVGDHQHVAARRINRDANGKAVGAEFRIKRATLFPVARRIGLKFGALVHPVLSSRAFPARTFSKSLDFGCLRPYIGSQRLGENVISEIYNQRILELAGNIPRLGRLANPDASAKAHSRLCGSTVTIDLCVKDGRVVDFAHEVRACALGQASSSLMARHVIGASAEELNELRDRVTRMLKANGPPPQGKWAEFAVLEPVRDYKARHTSTLLTFDAVADALAQVAAREAAPEAAPAP
jgi:NifU-like protein involved in Fe-S cluster formation